MMGQLIEDLLAFSRLGRTEISATTLDIGGMIREVWEDLRAINPDRRLTLNAAELPRGKGDRVLIKQVLAEYPLQCRQIHQGTGRGVDRSERIQ